MTRFSRYISPVIVSMALPILAVCGKDSPTQPNYEPAKARITATQDAAAPPAEVAVKTADADRAVLTALYNATNGTNWTNKGNWLSERPLGDWYGVTTDENGRVTELRLTANNLNGSIPSNLGDLDRLAALDFESNGLNGTIPPELGKLRNLAEFWLSLNNLEGTVPPDMGRLVKLKSLGLASNNLTGSVPVELSQLTNVSTLYLADNAGLCVTDDPRIQAWLDGIENKTFTNCSEVDVQALTAFYNSTGGPAWTNSENWLSDAPLKDWFGVTTDGAGRVAALQIINNNLQGTLPSGIASLSRLRTLNLSGNAGLTGQVPSGWTALRLESLNLDGTGVCVKPDTGSQEWLNGIPDRSVSYCDSEVDIQALTAFYDSTGGPSWTNSENWLSDAPLKDWFGVTTDGAGRVAALQLINNNLQGTPPPGIASLSRLRTLNLSGNAGLTGQVPSGWTALRLESLNLDGTGVCVKPDTGIQEWLNGIPDRSVSECVKLDTAALAALVGLYTSTNGKSWTNNDNWLSQAPLASWHGVTVDVDGRVTGLDLSDNNLSGSLPSSLSKLADLKNVNLEGNARLLGPIPESLTTLAIESLNLEGTGLCAPSGSSFRTWLDGIGDKSGVDDCATDQPDWEALVTFYNETNGPNWKDNTNWLSAEPLDEWFGVSTDDGGRVISLWLDWNNLLGPLPAALGDLEQLEYLNLNGNEISGPIPPELGKLKDLQVLSLFFCWISGSIPPELGGLTRLEELNLGDNGTTLTGRLPAELGKLTNLRALSLSGNGFHGPIPAAWGQMSKLGFLILSYNRLSGSIPGELGQLANLTELRIEGNELSGRIPRELGGLSGLETLNMSRNRLAGRIPVEIGALTNLTALNLGRNELTGSIPGALSRMASLERLNLSHNRFTGSVPGALGRMTDLKELVLAGNAGLAGPLPAELVNLNLETLMLGDTQLCVPQTDAFQHWIRFVPNSRAASCAVPVEATAYLTQASQSLDHPVPLVAGEDALLRVFLKTGGNAGIPMPPVRASFYRGGGVVYVADTPGEATDVPASFDEETLTATANIRVPGSVVIPGMEVEIEIDPDETLDPAIGLAGRIPENGRIAPDVRELPTFDLTLVPYLWVDGPDHSVLSAIDGLTPESELMRPTRDLLPVNDFQLTVHAPVWTSVDPNSDNVGTMGPELEALYAVEGETGYYMGLFRAQGSGGLLGIAAGIPSYLSFSILDPFVIAHELGHNLNLFHAPCGGADGPDPFYPYDDGSIGVSGFDMSSESLVSPQTWDLMSYCEPMWISDYSFSRAMNHRITLGATIPPGSAPVARGLLLWGGLDEYGELTLEPAFVVDAPVKLPETDGPYTISGERADGSGLFSLSFAISEYADAEGGSFAFILPVRADWPGNLARISLSGPGGFASIGGDGDGDGDAGRHMALMRDEITGEVRGIFRDWPDPSDSSTAGRRIPPEPGMEITVSGGVPGQDSW